MFGSREVGPDPDPGDSEPDPVPILEPLAELERLRVRRSVSVVPVELIESRGPQTESQMAFFRAPSSALACGTGTRASSSRLCRPASGSASTSSNGRGALGARYHFNCRSLSSSEGKVTSSFLLSPVPISATIEPIVALLEEDPDAETLRLFPTSDNFALLTDVLPD